MLSDVERKKWEAAHFFVERLNERARNLIILKVICADLQLKTWIIFREPVEYLVYPLSYLRKRLFFIGRKEVLFEMEEEEIR